MNKELKKSLSRLTALKDNIPKSSWTPRKYVDEFNSALAELEKQSGESLAEFVISPEEVKPRVVSHSPYTGRKYSSEAYCDREFILMKIDGVLGYFTLMLQPEEINEQLGFRIKKQ